MPEKDEKQMRTILAALLFLLPLCSCSYSDYQDNPELLNIVCTSFPAYDFSKNLSGDKAEIRLMIPPGSESHSFDPKPSDIIAIEQADIFIYGGGESDTWAKEALAALGTSPYTVSMCDIITPLEHNHNNTVSEHKHSDKHSHEFDEHVWTSPKNAVLICNEITKALINIDAKNTDFYSAASIKYTDKLLLLDERLRKISDNATNKLLIFGDRFPFRYLAKDYGFDYIAAFPGCAQITEPTAKTVAQLIDKVKTTNSSAIFYVEFSNRKICDTVSEDTGAVPMLLHSCHNITKSEFEQGIGYIELMNKNADTLAKALNQGM